MLAALPVNVQGVWSKPRRMLAALCAAACFCVCGCAVFYTHDHFGRSWSGKMLTQITQAWGDPAAQEILPDGSTEIRYDIKKWRCTYWFTADKTGKIVSYRYEVGQWGTCKPV